MKVIASCASGTALLSIILVLGIRLSYLHYLLKMPKRSHSQATSSTSTNPLSDARKVQDHSSGDGKTKKQSEPLSKADLKAKELWHRKSGLGFHLFVEYYGGQPMGVVYDDSDLEASLSCGNANASLSKQGKGMSRAAKRRKKKNPQKQQGQKNKMEKSDDSNCSISSSSLSPKFEAALKDKPDCRLVTSMLSYMSTALPLTLRIRQPSFSSESLKRDAKLLVEQLERKYSHLIEPVQYDATKNTIYQAKKNTALSKFSLGKISPDLKALIVNATASSLVARQELGSMLPVVALAGVGKLQYGSKLLDMCACPGSKTLQALEILATSPIQPPTRKPGRIVANDVHPTRLDSLKDAVKRSGVSPSLTDRIVYTNHDASKFPTPKSGSLFDCIMADVPCSGDGTIRKDPHVLPGWMPSISNSLHGLQLSILKRAIKLLKVGGVVCYSTCSMNPIEDEAVVASALAWANRFEDGSAELLQWPDSALPGFKHRPGVDSWRVGSYHWGDGSKTNEDDDAEGLRRIQWYETFEAATSDNMPHASPSMWPSPHNSTSSINLKYCTRLLPQDNDTGGFFVALIKKNKETKYQVALSDT